MLYCKSQASTRTPYPLSSRWSLAATRNCIPLFRKCPHNPSRCVRAYVFRSSAKGLRALHPANTASTDVCHPSAARNLGVCLRRELRCCGQEPRSLALLGMTSVSWFLLARLSTSRKDSSAPQAQARYWSSLPCPSRPIFFRPANETKEHEVHRRDTATWK